MDNNVTKAFQNIQNERKINIVKSFGVSTNDIQKGREEIELSPEQQEIVKSLSSDNPFEVEYGKGLFEKSDLSNIEKSDILNALSYGDNTNIVNKTGKEIKEQIKTLILPTKQAELATKKTEADILLSKCGTMPTKEVYPYWRNDMKIDVGYKIYDWEECRLRKSSCDCVYDSIDWEGERTTPNCPETEEQCEARNKYNSIVSTICEIMVDIKTCEVLIKNLKDESNISLNIRQLLAFKF